MKFEVWDHAWPKKIKSTPKYIYIYTLVKSTTSIGKKKKKKNFCRGAIFKAIALLSSELPDNKQRPRKANSAEVRDLTLPLLAF